MIESELRVWFVTMMLVADVAEDGGEEEGEEKKKKRRTNSLTTTRNHCQAQGFVSYLSGEILVWLQVSSTMKTPCLRGNGVVNKEKKGFW